MDFEWSIVPTPHENAGYTVDPEQYQKTRFTRSVYLPENNLEPGNNYTFRLWGGYRPGKIEGLGHSKNNTGSVKVVVMPGALVARIGGGNRIFSTQVDLVLDASQSEDEDSSEEEMRYEWQCTTYPEGGPCIDYSNATLLALADADEEDEILPPEIVLPPISRDPILTVRL